MAVMIYAQKQLFDINSYCQLHKINDRVQVRQLTLNCWYPVSDYSIKKPPTYTNKDQGHTNVPAITD